MSGKWNVNVIEYNNYSYNPKIGGFKLINYFCEKGIFKTKKEYFEWYNKIVKDFGFTKGFKGVKEVVNICKEAGGKVILAHPSYYYKESVMPKDELDNFRSYEIDGIECYSPYIKPEYYKYYVDYCKEYNLLITAGSDCHGDFTPDRTLATPKVTKDMIRLER